ncbi:MAG: hypothetical protein IJP95_08115 [Bacteroidales bacterium]|nr:hypothetical protein [Bacteroidales bacterium]
MLAFFHIAKSQDLPNLNLFEAHTHCTGTDTLPYRLYCSEMAKSADADTAQIANGLPLVVFLHGAGERGNNNADQLRLGVSFFSGRQHNQPRSKYCNRFSHPSAGHWCSPSCKHACYLW